MKIEFGEDLSRWGDYGYQELPLIFNGEPTGYKAIIRRGKLVNILGQGYVLLPHEYAIEIADQAAELVGLEPFSRVKVWGLKKFGEHSHVLVDDLEIPRQMRAVYLLPDALEPIDGEEVHVGVDVFNSIDGSTAFGASIFTYRYVCENGVFIGKESVFSLRKIHTKSLNDVIEHLKYRLTQVMERAPEVLETYRRLAEQKITEKLIERIKKSRLSRKVLPDYITVEEVSPEVFNISQWELYNDITEAIWHNVKAGMKTKTFQFKVLHQVLGVSL